MSNFEAKHPRAKDGKFIEKHRKESGLTLESALADGSYPAGDEWDDIPGVDPINRAAFMTYSEELLANGLTPDVEDFDESFQGEYASFDDFAAGYANDMVIDGEDYEQISEFFNYDAYKRDTGLGEEEAEELITSGDTETVKRYFDYRAFARDFEDSYAVDDAPGGNVFVFQRN